MKLASGWFLITTPQFQVDEEDGIFIQHQQLRYAKIRWRLCTEYHPYWLDRCDKALEWLEQFCFT
jgi:hypothetical protein